MYFIDSWNNQCGHFWLVYVLFTTVSLDMYMYVVLFIFQFTVSCNYGEDIKLACELTIGTVPLLDIPTGVVTSQPLTSGGLPPPIGFSGLEVEPSASAGPTKPPDYSDLRKFSSLKNSSLHLVPLKSPSLYFANLVLRLCNVPLSCQCFSMACEKGFSTTMQLVG